MTTTRGHYVSFIHIINKGRPLLTVDAVPKLETQDGNVEAYTHIPRNPRYPLSILIKRYIKRRVFFLRPAKKPLHVSLTSTLKLNDQ